MILCFPILVCSRETLFPGNNYRLYLDTHSDLDAAISSKLFYSGLVIVAPSTIPDKFFHDRRFSSRDLFNQAATLCYIRTIKEDTNAGGVYIDTVGIGRVFIKNIFPLPISIKESEVFREGIIVCDCSRFDVEVSAISKTKRKLNEFLENVFWFLVNDMNVKKRNWFYDSISTPPKQIEQVIDICASLFEGFSDTKLKFFQSEDLLDRLDYLVDMTYDNGPLSSLAEAVENDIKNGVAENVQRQQKEFYLREKLKVIREALGDHSLKDSEIKRLVSKFEAKKFPERISDRINEELRKLETCGSFSSEATVIRSYVDWLLDLPWLEYTDTDVDLQEVQEYLDSTHYGLKKIKDRVLEYLAVQKKAQQAKGTIICLVGPPGVGKTSLVISIAEALGREFVKLSLGGVHDEADIRGHRKTYVGSMPGRIIRSLKQAEVNNPVILLDELDKLGSGYHGDPVHALLEVLDTKQNTEFEDHYIEEPFDLSNVMFIATANDEDQIPEPLFDRLEVIYLETYTELEKLHIAKKHLMPEVFEESGISDEDELILTDEALLYIIQKYTRESGVRNLKMMIQKIVRKFVKNQLFGKMKTQTVDVAAVKEYLGYEIYDHTECDEDALPGVVNGMAYTAFGGDLLPIEVNHMSGKGALALTGNLKDTMRESASVALSFIRANEDWLGLKDLELDWNNLDLNLHVPTGGVPKDGPSAGVTIVTAMVSSLTNRIVNPRIAMTGEITLRGKVLPIGGLKEKIVSAVRGGINTIFYPDQNTKNLIDVPDEIKEKITLIPVKHYRDIYQKAFEIKKE